MNGISIVIAVYNTGNYLRDCLESIIKQDFPLFEIVLINDGSNDQTTLDIINEYSSNKLLNIVNTKNDGVSSARNIGIKESKFDLITFVDSDDIVKNQYLSELFNNMMETNADISVIGVEKFLDEDCIKNGDEKASCVIFNKNQAIQELLNGNIKGYCCGKLFKKSLIRDIWFDTEIKIMEDHCFVNAAINKSNLIVCSDLNLYFYRIHEESATQKFNKNKLLSIHKVVSFLLDYNDPVILGKCKASLINIETSMLFVLASHNSLDKKTYHDAIELINRIKKISSDRISFAKKKYALKYQCLKYGRHVFIFLSLIFKKIFLH